MGTILFWCYCCSRYCRPTFTSVAPPVDEVEATKRSQPVLASWPATLPCVHNVSTMCRVVWCVTILNQPFLVSTMCLRRVVWCLTFWTNPSLCPQWMCLRGVWQSWTNPSLCPHSGLNRVYNVWCLQILNQPLLHCQAYKFCSNPWFCLHPVRNLPSKDFVFFGNSFFWVLCV